MSSSLIVHGIPNCDTVKRARAWLATQGHEAPLHDFRKQGVPEALSAWIATLGWEKLLNRQGTTWRQLDASRAAAVVDSASAEALMRELPAVIRRPVVTWPDGEVTVGFDPERFSARLAESGR
ncbi:MAG: ArsC/Spx/MgsR family protein [Rubrivivax sp.]|jgi:arsenate reductase